MVITTVKLRSSIINNNLFYEDLKTVKKKQYFRVN